MQSLNVLLQLLQPEIASTPGWLSTTTSLTTFVPGADRLASARSGIVWGLLRQCGTDSALGVALCAMYYTDACVSVHVLILASSTPHQHEHLVR